MVAYSGGKCLRGPQAAGLLLGQKDLVRAAWLHSAPHHAFGRSLKVGKEEIMGMLAAVEAWVKRDYKAEFRTWESWLAAISERVTKVAGVATQVRQPNGLSNHSPTLAVSWDAEKLGITGREVENHLYDTEPRIVLGGSTPSSVTIMPYMMQPEDHKIVAARLHTVLSKPPSLVRKQPAGGPAANLAGQWDLHMKYFLGGSEHNLVIEQKNDALQGTHRGELTQGELAGSVHGDEVLFRSRHRYEGATLDYEFTGKASGEAMSGTVAMGEYGLGEWSATRRRYRG